MQTELLELKSAFESGCMAFCLWSLLGIGCVAVLFASGVVKDLLAKWTRMSRIDKAFVVVSLTFMTLTGATKGINWSRVYNGGADDNIALIGIYTGTSNEVVTVEGSVTTNKIPMVMYMWTGSGASQNTDVSYRYADTNYWTTVTKTRVEAGSVGTTNYVMFATSTDLSSYRNWWLGEDLPPIVILTTGIDLTSFECDSHGVDISWTCEDPRAATFEIWCKQVNEVNWTKKGETSSHSIRVLGFYLDKSYQWRITSTFME